MTFLINKLGKGNHKNKSGCILKKISPNYFIFEKKFDSTKNWCWCGFNYTPKSKTIYLDFFIKFKTNVPSKNSGFYLKTHNYIRYYDDWLSICKKDIFVKVCFKLDVKNVEQSIIFIADKYKDKLVFEVKNFRIFEKNDHLKLSAFPQVKEDKKINLIIKGYLFKKSHKPLSNIDKIYTQDFKKVFNGYKKLINELKKKYKVNVIFISYNNTPKEYIELIKNNNWNTFLIDNKNANQFTGTILYLKKNYNYNSLILRSDLIIKDEFIKKVNSIKLNYLITVFTKEEKGFYNDTVIFLPKCYIFDFIDNLLLKENKFGFWCHYYKKELPICITDKDNGGPRIFTKYVEIYRG